MNQPKDLGAKGLSTPPHGVSEQQARDIVAYYWITQPNLIYEGLKQAFSLTPTLDQTLQ